MKKTGDKKSRDTVPVLHIWPPRKKKNKMASIVVFFHVVITWRKFVLRERRTYTESETYNSDTVQSGGLLANCNVSVLSQHAFTVRTA
jgi:hypothetical protein